MVPGGKTGETADPAWKRQREAGRGEAGRARSLRSCTAFDDPTWHMDGGHIDGLCRGGWTPRAAGSSREPVARTVTDPMRWLSLGRPPRRRVVVCDGPSPRHPERRRSVFAPSGFRPPSDRRHLRMHVGSSRGSARRIRWNAPLGGAPDATVRPPETGPVQMGACLQPVGAPIDRRRFAVISVTRVSEPRAVRTRPRAG
jgi:hypothetical protein